ncbi:uncharacterized protein LOC117224097 [Megalopta genalis]|uniref:uncharacterized protein LOC117224097 n=1 Tax=Megalopta genalis TaxID=115081 RepID=UPI003FD5BB4B
MNAISTNQDRTSNRKQEKAGTALTRMIETTTVFYTRDKRERYKKKKRKKMMKKKRKRHPEKYYLPPENKSTPSDYTILSESMMQSQMTSQKLSQAVINSPTKLLQYHPCYATTRLL